MSVNQSEARLAEQSRQTFLSMWSYQNPHYGAKRDELCDVIVVYGDDVIIMSDKVINYNAHRGTEVAWKAWHKKAVLKSVGQLVGAKNTITREPTSVYLDPGCSSPFPLAFPVSARIHLVAVAHGCEAACQAALGRPSLAIDSRKEGGKEPFHVGVQYDKAFVHVFNGTALDALFKCFDTAIDLIEYLRQKEKLFAEKEVWVRGEEDLMALYMRTRQPRGDVDLARVVRPAEGDAPIAAEGEWRQFHSSAAFAQRRQALAPSYLIDNIIEQVASEYSAGRMLIGQDLSLAAHEAAFRTLASEPRMARLLIGIPLAEVLTEDPKTFWAEAVDSPEHPDVLYVWLIYPVVPDEVLDEDLERVVGQQLEKHVFVAMAKFPRARRVYGVAMPNYKSKRTSRMYRFMQRNVWTEKMQRDAENLALKENIFANIESTIYFARDAI